MLIACLFVLFPQLWLIVWPREVPVLKGQAKGGRRVVVYLVWVRYGGMLGDTVTARCCTLCDVCVTGGRAGVWPTTSTYTGRSVAPLCHTFWLTAPLRTGLAARGAKLLCYPPSSNGKAA